MNKFYIYILFRPWNLVPCYVGKGCGGRAWEHTRDVDRHYNKHLARIFRKARYLGLEVPVVILHDGLDEVTAFEYERAFITAIGRADQGNGPLCNHTDGGEGGSGWIPSDEDRRKRSVALTGKKHSPERCAANGAGKKGKPLSELQKFRIGNALRGKPKSSEHVAKVAAANTGKKRTPEQCAKHIGNKYGLGHKRTPEQIENQKAGIARARAARLAAGLPPYKQSPETIAKRVAAMARNRAAKLAAQNSQT